MYIHDLFAARKGWHLGEGIRQGKLPRSHYVLLYDSFQFVESILHKLGNIMKAL